MIFITKRIHFDGAIVKYDWFDFKFPVFNITPVIVDNPFAV